MTKPYIMAIDQGTTGTTVLILDVSNRTSPSIIGRQTIEFPQHYPQAGWVEHDLDEIFRSLALATTGACDAAKLTHSKFSTNDIACIGITNQRETLCTFEPATARPLRRAIVWQDRRSHEICTQLKPQESFLRESTGLVFDPYFSGTKMAWLMRHDSDNALKIRQGKALFGTIDTYLLYRLTNGSSYATEPSNASRTQLFNIKKAVWDDELAQMLELPHLDCLPEVKSSSGLFGHTAGLSFLPDGIPITGILGDQQAALAGQTCFNPGEAKCTYGTGAFMLLNTGHDCPLSKSGMLTTVAWSLEGQLTYALEGSCFIAGAAIQFLRDQFEFLSHAKDSEQMSANVVAAPEVYFVPALAGLGAPHWSAESRGAIFGLTRGTTKNQIIKAALEGIAFSVTELYQAMVQDFSGGENILRVDGGACSNNLLMQFQSDLLNLTVDRPAIIETTAFGAALFAGLGAGLYQSIDELRHMRTVERLFEPNLTSATRQAIAQQMHGWAKAINAVKAFSP